MPVDEVSKSLQAMHNMMGFDSSSGRPPTQQETANDYDELVPFFKTLNDLVDLTKSDNIPIQDMFDHKHFLSSAEGSGAFMIVSLFSFKHWSPGIPP